MLKRWLIVIAILGVAIGVAWKSLPTINQPPKTDTPELPFTLKDLKGVAQTLPKGKVVLLNFWATWCPPCREEIPSLVMLQRKFADKGLAVVAVSVDKNADDVISFARQYDLSFQILHDPDAAVSQEYGVYKYPETFLIDRNGIIRQHLIGAVNWMSAPALQGIERMLNEPGGPKVS
jgi:DsbE subfamily thiol:disulfide oxidoreductase